ncbi:hypothetical protein BB561_004844 [Smittium simulii]|uniref:Uncharacterized protein n=1 Tax=Smittium simulii TaxID=133385 RepID=A0A2T9YDU5_9FUNG|nr:hypothetical protein BB561_004844 [Smittium simulii]
MDFVVASLNLSFQATQDFYKMLFNRITSFSRTKALRFRSASSIPHSNYTTGNWWKYSAVVFASYVAFDNFDEYYRKEGKKNPITALIERNMRDPEIDLKLLRETNKKQQMLSDYVTMNFDERYYNDLKPVSSTPYYEHVPFGNSRISKPIDTSEVQKHSTVRK